MVSLYTASSLLPTHTSIVKTGVGQLVHKILPKPGHYFRHLFQQCSSSCSEEGGENIQRRRFPRFTAMEGFFQFGIFINRQPNNKIHNMAKKVPHRIFFAEKNVLHREAHNFFIFRREKR